MHNGIRTLHGEYVISLSRLNSRLIIVAYRGKNRILLSWMKTRFVQLRPLFACTTLSDNTIYVSLAKLEQVKAVLDSLTDTNLIVDIEPAITELVPITLPSSFIISYRWSPSKGALTLCLDGATYAGGGWFINGNTYFQLPILQLSDDIYLDKPEISGQDLITFLTKVLPGWHKRGVPVHCELTFSKDPLLGVTVKGTSESKLTLDICWNKRPHSYQALQFVEEYVIDGQVVQPGPAVHQLPPEFLASEGVTVYEGSAIHWFLDKVYLWIKPWVIGDIKVPAKIRVPTSTKVPTIIMDPEDERMHAKSEELEFIAKANEYADVTQERAGYLPYWSMYPNYAYMSKSQLSWYFYWRNMTRQQNYLPTDMAYVLLYIFELIHQVGVKSPEEGYEALVSLWRHYRGHFRLLDEYVIEWLVDYRIVYNLPNPLEIYEVCMEEKIIPYYPEIILERYYPDHLDQVPLSLLAKFIDYDIFKGRFYQQNEALVDKSVPIVIHYVSRCLQRTRGKGLFDQIPLASHIVRRPLFEGVWCFAGPKEPVTITTIRPYSNHQPFRQYLTAIIRYIENKLRSNQGYSSLLRVRYLDAMVQKRIDEYFTLCADKMDPDVLENQEVKIDFSVVTKLRADSEKIAELLLTESERMEQEECEQKRIKLPAVNPLEGTPEEFTDALNEYHVTALLVIYEGCDVELRLRELAATQLEMVDMLVDTINEIALDVLGDIIIECTDTLEINGEYLDILVWLKGKRGE